MEKYNETNSKIVKLKVIGVGIITSIAVMIIKQLKPEMAVIVGMTGSIIILLMILNSLEGVIESFTNLTEKIGVDNDLFILVLKIIGIGYITEFSANLCNDCGSSGIADKILLAGKVVIMLLSIPIINRLIEIISGLMML